MQRLKRCQLKTVQLTSESTSPWKIDHADQKAISHSTSDWIAVINTAKSKILGFLDNWVLISRVGCETILGVVRRTLPSNRPKIRP